MSDEDGTRTPETPAETPAKTEAGSERASEVSQPAAPAKRAPRRQRSAPAAGRTRTRTTAAAASKAKQAEPDADRRSAAVAMNIEPAMHETTDPTAALVSEAAMILADVPAANQQSDRPAGGDAELLECDAFFYRVRRFPQQRRQDR